MLSPRFPRVAALAAGVALLSLSSLSVAVHAEEAKIGDIAVVEAWARATPAKAGGVFLTLRNDGAVADRLVGAATPEAAMAHLHETRKVDGIMEMRPVNGVDLPPHATVKLEPGGYHVMLMGLEKPLKEGESFPLTLTFAKAGQGTVTVAVEAAGASGGGKSMDHMDMDKMNHGSGQ